MSYGRRSDAYFDQRVAEFLTRPSAAPPVGRLHVSQDAYDPFGYAARLNGAADFLTGAVDGTTEQALATSGRGVGQFPPYEPWSGRAGTYSQVFDPGPDPSKLPRTGVDGSDEANDRRFEDTPEAWGDYHGQVPLPRQGVDSFGLVNTVQLKVILNVGPLQRFYWARRDPKRMQRDAVIWFHPGGGKVVLPGNQGFLNAIVPDPDRIDVAPQGLKSFGFLPTDTGPKSNWGLPGLPDTDPVGGVGQELIPKNMHPLYPRPTDPPADGPRVSKWHDLQFVCLMILDVLRRFPNVRRIWLAGFSKGCTMVMASYAFNNMAHRGLPWAWPLSLVRGYYLGDFGVTMRGVGPNDRGYGWSIVDGIDWGWVLSNSSPTRRAGDPGQASGVVVPMDPIVRPVLFRHGSQLNDGLPSQNGMAKTWAESAADLLRLHRCPRWNDGLAGTDADTGWYRYDPPSPKVCLTGGSLDYRPAFVQGWAADEYPAPAYQPSDAGRVRARYALRDPRFPKWPAPHSQRRATAPLGEIEVINADHGNFIVLRDPNCTDPYWDEVRLATDFFRDNGLGT